MLIQDVYKNAIEAFIYLERYVNDGSPSGFTLSKGVSESTHPLYGKEFFDLPVYCVPHFSVVKVGNFNKVDLAIHSCSSEQTPVPLHPDLLVSGVLLPELLRNSAQFTISVAPTASGRTVLTNWREGAQPVFIKLHYPQKIGRFSRGIPLFKWIAAVESARLVRSYVKNSVGRFKVFDEFAGVYIEGADQGGFGTMFRDFPISDDNTTETALIPAFALFSRDCRRPNDPSLIAQLIQVYGYSVDNFIEEIIEPLVNNYVHIATNAGLLPECNAQNVIFNFSINGKLKDIYIRDMEDVWKDISLLHTLNLDTQYVEYHTIREGVDADYYKRRSFMYDFKLGEYILAPLARVAALPLGTTEGELLNRIRYVGRKAWSAFPNYFRPAEQWFCYPNQDSVSRVSYEERSQPKFR